MSKVAERFLKYVVLETTSCEESKESPSTRGQLDFARMLVQELEQLHLKEIRFDPKGYVYATLPANTEGKIPAVGFIAHMDTSPEVSGAGVKPGIVRNYDGKEILLNQELGIVLSPAVFPELKSYTGCDLITTDGTTLLGADDKAGIAEILTAVEFLINNPGIKHGKIMLGFTPDEEVGRGTEHFDIQGFGADFAYTVDGNILGELIYENFNAAAAKITVKGRNVHAGTAKNKMINSITAAMELAALLPADQKPEFTSGYEGFFHLRKINGAVDHTVLEYIIRDHDLKKFQEKKALLGTCVDFMNRKYGDALFTLEVSDTYFNMREKIEPVKYIVDLAARAMQLAGVTPLYQPIRGGTDGAVLSYKGLPCPNIFTGGHNAHSLYEYIPISSMEKAVQVLVHIAQLAVSLPQE